MLLTLPALDFIESYERIDALLEHCETPESLASQLVGGSEDLVYQVSAQHLDIASFVPDSFGELCFG